MGAERELRLMQFPMDCGIPASLYIPQFVTEHDLRRIETVLRIVFPVKPLLLPEPKRRERDA